MNLPFSASFPLGLWIHCSKSWTFLTLHEVTGFFLNTLIEAKGGLKKVNSPAANYKLNGNTTDRQL